jgi:hypothetical protein
MERKEFQRLVEELQRISLENGYTKAEIAARPDINAQSVRSGRAGMALVAGPHASSVPVGGTTGIREPGL